MADLLGVGRPALSQLLNEHAALSPEMALRLEIVFGVNMDALLLLQTRYDIARMRKRRSELKLAPYTTRP